MAQLVYDVTVRFCDRFIGRRSRTHDQMVQAARSGTQNIAEGSQVSGTSKVLELKLTNVARASLEELRLDYEDFLRQRGLAKWPHDDPRRQALVSRRCISADEVASWVGEIASREIDGRGGRRGQSGHRERSGRSERLTREAAGAFTPSNSSALSTQAEIAANAALVLINVAASLLDRQIQAQARAFERDGGFTERLSRRRRGTR